MLKHDQWVLWEMGAGIILFLLRHQGAAGRTVLPVARETVGVLTCNIIQGTRARRMEEGISQELIFFL